jgi:hypothetical protein
VGGQVLDQGGRLDMSGKAPISLVIGDGFVIECLWGRSPGMCAGGVCLGHSPGVCAGGMRLGRALSPALRQFENLNVYESSQNN